MNEKFKKTLMGDTFNWFCALINLLIAWEMIRYNHVHMHDTDGYWKAIVYGFWIAVIFNVIFEFGAEAYCRFGKEDIEYNKTVQAIRLAFVSGLFAIAVTIMGNDHAPSPPVTNYYFVTVSPLKR
jgi:uncharacterized membrane protein